MRYFNLFKKTLLSSVLLDFLGFKVILFAFLLSLISFSDVFSQRKIIIQNPNEAQLIGRQIEVFEDKTASLSFEKVSKRSDIDARFTQSIQPNPNFGVTSSVIWARFTLQNKSSQKLYLEISEPVIYGQGNEMYIN